MTTLIVSEWYKILRSRALAIILVGVAAFTFIQVLSSYFMQEFLLGQNSVAEIGRNSSILSLGMAAFVGFFVASEFQYGTMRNVLALGKNRMHVFLSKVLSACVAVAAIIAVFSIAGTVGFSMAFGFGDMALGEFSRFFVWNFSMQLLYHLTLAAIFTMFAFLSKSPGMTILLSVGYVIATLAIAGFLNNFPGGTLKFALEFFPQYYSSNIDDLSGELAFITDGVIVSVAYIALACIIGVAVFKKYVVAAA